MRLDRKASAGAGTEGYRCAPCLLRVDIADSEHDQIPWELKEGVTRVGRSDTNDLCLDDTSVSRFQCCLLRHGDEVRVFDARSRNTTRVGKREACGQSLEDGDTLSMGRCRLTFLGAEQRRTGPLPPPNRSSTVWRRSKLDSLFPVVFILLFTAAGAAWILFSPGPTDRIAGNAKLPGGGYGPGQASVQPSVEQVPGVADGNRVADLRKALAAQQREIATLTRQLTDGVKQTTSSSSTDAARTSGKRAMRTEIARLESARAKLAAKYRQALLGPRTFDGRSDSAAEKGEHEWHSILQTPYGTPSKPAAEEITPKQLSSAEIHELVDELVASLDRFGEPGIQPGDLEPALTKLSSGIGRKPAEGLLRVYRHGYELREELDRTIEFLLKRNERLLKLAQYMGPESEQGSGSTKKGSRTKPSSRSPRGSAAKSMAELEKYQRQLELSEKKIVVQTDQRSRLMGLSVAVLDALARFRDRDATRYLSAQFGLRSDKLARLAILRALAAARATHSIPILIGRLRLRDDELAAAVHKTLVALTDEDFGSNRRAWEEWWSQKKSLLAPDQ